jgi:phosphoglucosamine mutase
VLVRRRWTLASATADYQPLPQQTVNVRITPGTRPLDAPVVRAARREAEAKLAGKGRLVLRPSGTEPVVRITVESADEALVEHVIDTLSAAVHTAT